MNTRTTTDRTAVVLTSYAERETRHWRHRLRRWGRLLLPPALVAATLVATPGTASAAVPGKFVIDGSGYGHGIGMPQYGAYEMSRRGSTTTGILAHYYRGSSAARVTTPALIDVQVYGPDPYDFTGYGDTTATKVTVRDGGWRLRVGDRTVAFGPAGTLGVTTSKGDIVVRTPDGRTIRRDGLALQWAGTPYYKPTADPATVTVRGTHGSYRYGRLLLSASEGVPNIVNRLRLNTQYLYGLAEMPASWGTSGGEQALRAQAVVARSYAVLKTAKRNPICECNLVDDVRDQQFSGWKNASGYASGYWRSAVDTTTTALTRGSTLTDGGRTVSAHYFSSSGGRTANSEDVWSSAIPYERSVSDPYSKVAPGNSYAGWRRAISQARAQDLFGLRQVESIRVTDHYSSGQARTLTARSPTGVTRSVTGKADKIRSLVGSHTIAGNVPSAWFEHITAD
jgi:stage II sporulation protein D